MVNQKSSLSKYSSMISAISLSFMFSLQFVDDASSSTAREEKPVIAQKEQKIISFVQPFKDKLASSGKNLYESDNLREEVVDYIWARYKDEIESDEELKKGNKQEVAKKLVSIKGINYDNIWFWDPEYLAKGLVYFYPNGKKDKILTRSFDSDKQKIIYKDEHGSRVKKRFVKIGLKTVDKDEKVSIKELSFDEKTGLPINLFQKKQALQGKGRKFEYGENLRIETLLTVDVDGSLYGMFIDSKIPYSNVSVHRKLVQKSFDVYELGGVLRGLLKARMTLKMEDILRDKKAGIAYMSVDEQKSNASNSWVSSKMYHIHFDNAEDLQKYIETTLSDSENRIRFVKINNNPDIKKLLNKWEKWSAYEKEKETPSESVIEFSRDQLLFKAQVKNLWHDVHSYLDKIKSDIVTVNASKAKTKIVWSQIFDELYKRFQRYLNDDSWFNYYLNSSQSKLPKEEIDKNLKAFIQLSVLRLYEIIHQSKDASFCILAPKATSSHMTKYSFYIIQVLFERLKPNGSMSNHYLNELEKIGIKDQLLFDTFRELSRDLF